MAGFLNQFIVKSYSASKSVLLVDNKDMVLREDVIQWAKQKRTARFGEMTLMLNAGFAKIHPRTAFITSLSIFKLC